MTILTDDDVRHIAALARIAVTDDDVMRYQKDLSGVLAYFEELNAVDTSGVAPIGHITGMTNVMRSDRAIETTHAEKDTIMSQVPTTQSGFIKVKSVF